MSPMLEARGCGLSVPGGAAPRWLVRGLDLEIRAGDRVAVLGPSGAGKTTLLRALTGLVTPTEGGVWLADRPIARWEPRARARQIAWLPQRAEPWSDVPAHEIVALGRTPHLGALARLGETDRLATNAALVQVGAETLAHRPWSSLSGGERQRVMLARMLASDARILLLDEPTAALDVGHAMRVMRCCDALAADGSAIVFATHDLDLAQRWADRVVCVGARTVVGTAAELLVPEIMGELFDVRAQWGRRMVFDAP